MARRGGYTYGMPSKAYWKQRSKERLAESFARGEEAEEYLVGLYRQNLEQFVRDYKDLVAPYTMPDGSIDGVGLRRQLRTDKQFKGQYRRLTDQIKSFSRAIGAQSEATIAELLKQDYKRTLVASMGDLGATPAFNLLSEEAVRKAVYTPFTADGREFSDRIWSNLADMNRNLRRELSNSIARGDSIDKTTRRLQKIFGNTAYTTQRLVRTETLATYAKASKASYEEAGLEALEIEAEGDACEICAGYDGDIVQISEAEVGVNIPPFHPNCRCCVLPVIKTPKKYQGLK